MKNKVIWLIIISFILTTGCSNSDLLSGSLVQTNTNNNNDEEKWQAIYETTMKRDILCLMIAYYEYIAGLEKKEDDKVYVVMQSGNKILYDDKTEKNFKQRLENPDLQDMMDQIYPVIPINKIMDENYDPGRIRSYPILKEVYGNDRNEIEKNLVNVTVGYKKYPFNKMNSATRELSQVMKELAELSKNDWKISTNVYPSSGTYNYRYIADTNRLSPHAFGIAIDLKRDKRDYWKWASKEQGEARIKEYPKKIVEVFERHNFVWGGKWSHFDILHFEYRPEIVLKAKYFSDKVADNDPWYEGVSLNNKKTREYIKLIEEVL